MHPGPVNRGVEISGDVVLDRRFLDTGSGRGRRLRALRRPRGRDGRSPRGRRLNDRFGGPAELVIRQARVLDPGTGLDGVTRRPHLLREDSRGRREPPRNARARRRRIAPLPRLRGRPRALAHARSGGRGDHRERLGGCGGGRFYGRRDDAEHRPHRGPTRDRQRSRAPHRAGVKGKGPRLRGPSRRARRRAADGDASLEGGRRLLRLGRRARDGLRRGPAQRDALRALGRAARDPSLRGPHPRHGRRPRRHGRLPRRHPGLPGERRGRGYRDGAGARRRDGREGPHHPRLDSALGGARRLLQATGPTSQPTPPRTT